MGDWYQAFRLPRSRRLPWSCGDHLCFRQNPAVTTVIAPRLEEVEKPVRDPVPRPMTLAE